MATGDITRMVNRVAMMDGTGYEIEFMENETRNSVDVLMPLYRPGQPYMESQKVSKSERSLRRTWTRCTRFIIPKYE
jgi:hypothetical protein